MKLLKVNILNFLLLCGCITLYFVTSKTIGICFIVCVLIFSAIDNYVVLTYHAEKSEIVAYCEEIKQLGEYNQLTKYTNSLLRSYISIGSRQETFDEWSETQPKMYEAYTLIHKQIKHNTDSCIAFLKAYDVVSRPEPKLLIKLTNENEELIKKLNTLVELSFTIDDSVGNIDTTVIDDMIDVLKSMSE